MPRQDARLVLEQFNLRPSYIAHQHASMPGPSSEIISAGLISDIRELATASYVEQEKAWQQRKNDMVAYAGLPTRTQDKPFAFSDGKAIIPIHGVLINRFSWSWSFATGYNFIRAQVEAALNDPDVDGIIYDVNSPGGTVAGCQETADIIKAASKAGGGKQSVAIVDASCYSAAYMCASGADKLVVTPTGGAGSIGVVLMHVDVSKALDEAGIKVTFIHAGDHKVDGNMYEPLAQETRDRLQGEVDKCYDAFVGTVVRNRPNLTDQAVRDTQALCYQAADALSVGLIDAVQTPPDALSSFFDAVDSGVDDDIQPEPDEMTDKTQQTTQNTGPTAEETRVAERNRVKGILGSEEAKGREGLAHHFAMETDMSVEAAVAALKAAPKQEAPKQEVQTTEQNHFKSAMDQGKHPNVGGAGAGNENQQQEQETRATQILNAQRRLTGVKTATAK